MSGPTGSAAIELRPVTAADEPFLYRLYADTRSAELAHVSWDAPAQEAFLRMQFDAQRRAYAAAHPDASHDVITLDGTAAGRLYVDRAAEEIALVDIALLAAYRGRGVGSRLLAELIAEARESGRTVRLQVRRDNPARRLYERLGFAMVADGEVYLALACDPVAAGSRAGG